MDDLKPCPFCGGEARTVVEYDAVGGGEFKLSAYVQCTVCGVYQRIKFDAYQKQFSDYKDVFERAISLWNQRS